MKKLGLSIAVSLLLHAVLVFSVIVYLEYAPQADALAALDLSSVELSFAEEEREDAATVPTSPSEGRRVPLPPQEEKPPEARREEFRPPEPLAPGFSEPREVASRMTPSAVHSASAPSTADCASVAPRQARVDAPPRLRHSIRPDYPKGARRRGEQGEVLLELCVKADGGVDAARVVRSSGFAELDAAALRATRAARFEPARAEGETVASVVRLPLRFKLK